MENKGNVANGALPSPGKRRASRLPRLGLLSRKPASNSTLSQSNQSKDINLPNADSKSEHNRKRAAQSEALHQETSSLTNRENQNPSIRVTTPSPHRTVTPSDNTYIPSRKDRPTSSTRSPSSLRDMNQAIPPTTTGSGIPSSNSKTGGPRNISPRRILKQKLLESSRKTDMSSFAEVAAAPAPPSPPQGAETTDRAAIGQNDGQNESRELPASSTNGNGKSSDEPASREALVHPDHSSAIHDSASYADALKTGLTNGDSSNEQNTDTDLGEKIKNGRNRPIQDDESDPDLDDMGLEEVDRAEKRRQQGGGVRWAPWNVPLRRRAQTFVVLLHCLSIVGTVSLFFALCANPFAWPLLLLYLLHVLTSKAATDGSLSYRWEWFRQNWFWHLFAEYFPAKLHKTCDLPPTRKYIFGYHPHGIISHGAWAAFATDALGFSEKFPGITNSLLTLDSNFRVPIYRDYILAMGVRSVSKESIINILSKGGSNGEGMGRGVTVVVGGARESLQAQPGYLRLILRERKGFVKIAVRTGADLVPVLCFGENELYDQLPPHEHPLVHRLQMFVLKVWKFTLPFMHGRGIFNYDVGLMPYRHPLNVVVGAPIKVEQQRAGDQQEYIDHLHGLYVEELEKLWETYKDEFAQERKEDLIMT